MSGTALTAQQIASSYTGLLKTADNAVISGSLRIITDGSSNDTALQLSNLGVYSSGTLGATGHVTFEGVTSTGATGTGKLVFDTSPTLTSPTLVTPALGTPASGVVTNLTGTASININGTVGATTPTTGAFTTLTASGAITATGNLVKIGSSGTFNGSSGLQFDISQSASGVEFFASNSSFGYGHRIIDTDSGAGYAVWKVQARTNSASWTDALVINGSTSVITNADLIKSDGTYGYLASTGMGAALKQFGSSQAYGLDMRRWTGTATTHSAAYIGHSDHGDGTFDLAVYVDPSKTTNTQATTKIAVFSSTGLAVTGTLSAARTAVPARTWTMTLENGTADYVTDATGAYPHRFFIGATQYAKIDITGLAVTGGYTGNFDGSGSYPGANFKDTTDTSGATFIGFKNGSGTVIGYVARVTTTNAVTYSTTSDRRIKENFGYITDSGRLIDALTPRTFDRKDGSDSDRKGWLGFVAQEVYAADPVFSRIGFVTKGDDNPDVVEKTWSVGGSPIDALLVAELKSLRARVAQLEAR